MAISRTYTVQFGAVAVSAAQDLFELTAAAGKDIELVAISLTQSTNLGDANEKELQVAIKSGQTTSGSGGSAPTPVPLGVTDAAAGFAAEVNNTTKASAGTIVTHFYSDWNTRMPFIWILPEDMRPHMTGSRRMTIELVNAPAASTTMSGTIWVREFG